MAQQARALLRYGPQAVLIKGGHFEGAQSPDLLASAEDEKWFEAERIDSANTHGTGCSLSSALAACLARGMSVVKAVEEAKSFITNSIKFADYLDVGSGHGPTHHFHALWKDE
jgi:hydroxymethylpyrimidine/phosphomethylpyrimidine kinase